MASMKKGVKVSLSKKPVRGRAPHKPTRPHKNPKAYSRVRDKKRAEREGKRGK